MVYVVQSDGTASAINGATNSVSATIRVGSRWRRNRLSQRFLDNDEDPSTATAQPTSFTMPTAPPPDYRAPVGLTGTKNPFT